MYLSSFSHFQNFTVQVLVTLIMRGALSRRILNMKNGINQRFPDLHSRKSGGIDHETCLSSIRISASHGMAVQDSLNAAPASWDVTRRADKNDPVTPAAIDRSRASRAHRALRPAAGI